MEVDRRWLRRERLFVGWSKNFPNLGRSRDRCTTGLFMALFIPMCREEEMFSSSLSVWAKEAEQMLAG